MRQYVAFLRGINVGGHNVKKDQLRGVFEGLGYARVSTFIASGNVLFATASKSERELEEEIELALLDRLGYAVATFVRSAEDLQAVAGSNLFEEAEAAAEGVSIYVTFVRERLPEEIRGRIDALRGDTDDFRVDGREIYWLCRTRISESPVFKRGLLDKAIGAPVTARNMTTIRKLAGLLGAATRQ